MNYYKRYPGDYMRDTAHLSLAEHGAYELLLDVYYATGKPLPNNPDALYRICRVVSPAEKKAVDSVVQQFFYADGALLRNARADKEIAHDAMRINTAKANGLRGGRPKTQDVTEQKPSGFPEENQEETQDEPSGKAPQHQHQKDLRDFASLSPLSRDVFEHWQRVHNHPQAKLTPERQRKIAAALKHYPPDTLKKAIDGCALTPHNMGENDRGERYDDLALILRDAAHIERFARNADNPPIPKGRQNEANQHTDNSAPGRVERAIRERDARRAAAAAREKHR